VTTFLPLVSFVIVLLLVVGVSVVAAAGAAVPLVGRGRVRRLAENGRSGARALETLVDQPSKLLGGGALFIGASYSAAAAASVLGVASAYPGTPMWLAALIGAVIGVFAMFVLGEALPRTVAVQNPEQVALSSARWALRLAALAYPVARLLSALWMWGIGLIGRTEVAGGVPWVTEEEYRVHAGGDEEETARDQAEEAILEAVSDFAEKVVREVMVPRTDMRCLEDTATVREALELIETSGYSRLPIYHETLDDIRGVLYAKDLLLEIGRAGEQFSPEAIAREPYFVPETKPVEELLVEMRSKTHMAIVADEYGGTAGLVTIEDLLEEIVGEIFDEYDRQIQMVVDLGDGRFRVDARVPVDELNELFDTAVEPVADTVGGLFTEIAGRIPERGESIEVEGLRLTVEDLQGTRIRQLTVEPAVRLGGENSR